MHQKTYIATMPHTLTSLATSLLQRMQTRTGSRRPASSTGRSVALHAPHTTFRQRRLRRGWDGRGFEFQWAVWDQLSLDSPWVGLTHQ